MKDADCVSVAIGHCEHKYIMTSNNVKITLCMLATYMRKGCGSYTYTTLSNFENTCMHACMHPIKET